MGTVRGPVTVLSLVALLAVVWGVSGIPAPLDLPGSIPVCAWEDGPGPCYRDDAGRRPYVIRRDGTSFGGGGPYCAP